MQEKNNINPNIEVFVDKQLMFFIYKGKINREFNISTSKYGIGELAGSNKTPIGEHIICEKIGNALPIYTVFKTRINTGIICQTINEPTDEDFILTRILRLKGMQEGINLGYNYNGENVDSYNRCIYIHGTNREDLLSTPASDGCIRMANSDIIELFNLVDVGTIVNVNSKMQYNY